MKYSVVNLERLVFDGALFFLEVLFLFQGLGPFGELDPPSSKLLAKSNEITISIHCTSSPPSSHELRLWSCTG